MYVPEALKLPFEPVIVTGLVLPSPQAIAPVKFDAVSLRLGSVNVPTTAVNRCDAVTNSGALVDGYNGADAMSACPRANPLYRRY